MAEVSKFILVIVHACTIVIRVMQQTPQCDMALVHDDDLTYIGGDVWLSSQPDELMDRLRGSSPAIQQFQCCKFSKVSCP